MRENSKTKINKDSEVPGGLPWSELNHYLKGLRNQADTILIIKQKKNQTNKQKTNKQNKTKQKLMINAHTSTQPVRKRKQIEDNFTADIIG